MQKSFVLGLALVSLLASAACTIVAEKNNPAASASTSKTDGGAATSDGGGATGGETDGGAAGGTGNSGSVILTQSSFTVGQTTIVSYSASAAFLAAAGGGGGASACTTSKEGDCVVIECDLSGAGGDNGGGGAAQKQPHAGDITIKAGQEITLAADDNGTYVAKSGQQKLFEGGEDISISAAGATVPAFDKTVKAPSTITLTAPELPAAPGKLSIDRSKALDVTWTDGAEGNVLATVATASADGKKSASLSCTFSAASGAGTIPAAALGKLLTSENAAFSVGASNTTTFKQGDWNISLLATSSGASGLAKVE